MTPEELAIMQLVNDFQTAVIVAAIAIISCVALGAAWAIWEFWVTPKESKEIRTCKRKGSPLIVAALDNGLAELEHADFSGPEGILSTKERGKTKEHFTGALPRPKVFEESDIELTDEKFDIKKTVAIANLVSSLANKKLFLKGAKVPVWFAYKGKAILASIYGLACLQILDKLKDSSINAIKEALAPVDFLAIKSMFDQNWNQSQLNAQEADKQRIGELKARKFIGKENLTLIFGLLIGVIVMAILFIVAAWFLGGGGG